MQIMSKFELEIDRTDLSFTMIPRSWKSINPIWSYHTLPTSAWVCWRGSHIFASHVKKTPLTQTLLTSNSKRIVRPSTSKAITTKRSHSIDNGKPSFRCSMFCDAKLMRWVYVAGWRRLPSVPSHHLSPFILSLDNALISFWNHKILGGVISYQHRHDRGKAHILSKANVW
jgi:hypothetical protein